MHGHKVAPMGRIGDCVFFPGTGHDARTFLSDKELVSSYLIPTLGRSSSFACDVQRHKRGMTLFQSVLQNKLNQALPA